MSRSVPFVHPVNIRYLEVDRQDVVFNMWYLAYFDDAFTAFLGAGGLPYTAMLEAGFDAQLVHTELDWRGPLGYGDQAAVEVRVASIGADVVHAPLRGGLGDRIVAEASTVYVAVRTDGSGKCPLPPAVLAALGPVS